MDTVRRDTLKILQNSGKDADGSTTISFMLPNELYEKLIDRLPKYGSRSEFFRTVVEQFLEGKIQVIQEIKF